MRTLPAAHLSGPRHSHEGGQDARAEGARDVGQQRQLRDDSCSLGLRVTCEGKKGVSQNEGA